MLGQRGPRFSYRQCKTLPVVTSAVDGGAVIVWRQVMSLLVFKLIIDSVYP